MNNLQENRIAAATQPARRPLTLQQISKGCNGAGASGSICLSVPISEPVSALSNSPHWLFPSKVLDIGGMSVLGQFLLEHLREEGIEARLLRTNPYPPPALSFVRGVPVLRAIVRSTQYLFAALKEVPRAALVHHYATSSLHFLVQTVPLLLLCKLWRRPVLLNYHSGDAERFLQRWGWSVKWPLRQADRLVVPSVFLQRIFAKHGLQAEILPNVAEVHQFPFKPRRQFAPRLIVARNLTPIYDVATILRAFHVVQRWYPEAVLGVVGTGPETYRLTVLAQRLDLRGVTFHAVIPNSDMPKLYTSYDIAINASVWDNFPGALVEAALSGLAIVSTAAGGIPDMFQHQQTGLLVDVGDHEALARAVIECVENPEKTHRRTLLARQWAEQYSWSMVFPILRRYYDLDEESPRTVAAPCQL
jgi:glycosyltransferase involved in cell wall biosynthesis